MPIRFLISDLGATWSFQVGWVYLLCHAHARVSTIIEAFELFRRTPNISWWFHPIKPTQDPIPKVSTHFYVSLLYALVNADRCVKHSTCSPIKKENKNAMIMAVKQVMKWSIVQHHLIGCCQVSTRKLQWTWSWNPMDEKTLSILGEFVDFWQLKWASFLLFFSR